MIHEILICLSHPNSDAFMLDELINSPASTKFIHPGERKTLEDIAKIARKHREIAKFVTTYKSASKSPIKSAPDGSHPKGMYLQSFAYGLEEVLNDYVDNIYALEKRFLNNPTSSLMLILNCVHKYDLLFSFLQNLIRGVTAKRYFGCAIVDYMHQNWLHGNESINAATKKIQSFIISKFLKQLSNWLFYGKLLDSYGEFFIQCIETPNPNNSGRMGSASSGKQAKSSLSDTTSNYTEIWQYELCYDLLPNIFSASWAEKVLFIGQTVLMFKTDPTKENKSNKMWIKSVQQKPECSLWNDKEHFYFKILRELEKDECINAFKYENIIDDIKKYISERLSIIAIDQADLTKQLKLIKDFYLLGRGELFLEFIRQTNKIDKTQINENTVRNVVTAFESSATSVNITEDIEKISITIPKENFNTEPYDCFGYIQYVQLNYKINWPLHLLFSPKVIERYNELFRFLLIIKKAQYDLHMVWYNRRTEKNIETLMLRNQLMFLIDNLQYYIQADVLESQFSIFMNTVTNSSDFEHIQRAHSIFQANIMSLCFLLSMDDLDESTAEVTHTPVLEILFKIFRLCEDFCKLMASTDKVLNAGEMKQFELHKNEFDLLVKTLFNLLNDLKAAPSATPLSQLLIRLDFNHWFSKETGKNWNE